MESTDVGKGRQMLPAGDHTYEGFVLPRDSAVERFIKRPIRRFGYPLYIFLVNQWLSRKYCYLGLQPDVWLWGQRGNDYARHRRRVNRILPLAGKNLLIVGCGTGHDVPSWMDHRPATVTGVDYFNYDKAWSLLRQQAARDFPGTKLDFVPADLAALSPFLAAAFDMVGSDAVFEHVRDLPSVLREFRRVLRPGGLVYATFGPLWYSWGGDHVSGSDEIANGFNHLLLDSDAYRRYLQKFGPCTPPDHDWRIWINHSMFSYLRPLQYLTALEDVGFTRVFVGAMIAPQAIRCLAENPQLSARLLDAHPMRDLITGAMTIIYRKPTSA